MSHARRCAYCVYGCPGGDPPPNLFSFARLSLRHSVKLNDIPFNVLIMTRVLTHQEKGKKPEKKYVKDSNFKTNVNSCKFD